MFEYKKELSREYILSCISEAEIFERFLGIRVNLQKRFKNPIRKDDTPDCKFYIDTRGVLKFHDFAMGWNWDCFNLVQHLYSCSFKKSFQIIAVEFSLQDIGKNITHQSVTNIILQNRERTPRVTYRVKRKSWDTNSLAFWKKNFDLVEEKLTQFKVSPAENLWINRGNGLEEIYRWTFSDPCYVYHFGDYNYQFYFPNRKKPLTRFIQSVADESLDLLMGEFQLPLYGDLLVITKSYKDIITLSSFDIPAVSPLGEGVIIKEEKIGDLKDRFTNIYSLFDFDRTGVAAAQRLKKKYNIPYLFFTNGRFGTEDFGAKDFSDFQQKYGIHETIDLIQYVSTKINLQ
jgi:hypothetical protein